MDGLTAAEFEQEVMALLPDIGSAARRLAGDGDEADDLVAEAVLRAWRQLDSLRDRSSFRGWLFRIMTNEFLSRQRSRSSRPAVERLPEGEHDFSLFERLHQPFLLWSTNPEQEFLNRLLKEDLERAIDALPDEFRIVIVLADMEGMKYNEIAEALEIPIGTVRSRLARARGRLQKQLWLHAVEAGVVRSNPGAERADDV